MCDTPPDPDAVHCPQCKAEPGRVCKSPSDKPQINHSERVQLAYALTYPDSGFYRAEAARYRMKYPDVEPRQITCEASAAQARWWAMWGRTLRYNRAAYEAEHGPDTSIAALTTGQQDEYVGMTASELMAQMPSQQKAPVKRKKRGD